jgi:hypothetical protein
MHEAAFSQAALPATAHVLGLKLRPYSLGHELWLLRESNPLATFSEQSIDLEKFGIEHLLLAVLICRRSYRECCELQEAGWMTRLELAIWNSRMKRAQKAVQSPRLVLRDHFAAFLDYQRRGSLEFRCEPPPDTGSEYRRTLGAPFLLILHDFVMTHCAGDAAGRPARADSGPTHLPLFDAWDYPMGLAKMRYAAHMEYLGNMRVENGSEFKARMEKEEWEREHPESGLKIGEEADESNVQSPKSNVQSPKSNVQGLKSKGGQDA